MRMCSNFSVRYASAKAAVSGEANSELLEGGGDGLPQCRRDLGHDAEPRVERAARLVEKQAEAVDGDVAPRARCGEQRSLRRDVDEVADQRGLRKPIERDIEWRLAGHA